MLRVLTGAVARFLHPEALKYAIRTRRLEGRGKERSIKITLNSRAFDKKKTRSAN